MSTGLQTPQTELHTHFAGVLSAKRLIDLALEHDLKLDEQTFKALGFADATYKGGPVPAKSLSAEQLKKLEAAMSLESTKQIAPYRLNELYRMRKFVTDDRTMFPHLLRGCAEEYAAQGVKYAELSYAGIVSSPELLKVIHETLPKLEQETGVKMRFLAGIWRHADQEWNLDELDRCKAILQSPYVAGIDVMGFERNSIRPLAQPLKEMVAWAGSHAPGFVARIHAGESVYYSVDPAKTGATTYNNLHESVLIFKEGKELNPDGPYTNEVQGRIGHGRYGLFTATLELMRKCGVIVELCLTSNYVLNNADNAMAPFADFLKHAVRFVLASDGHGTYGTTLKKELEFARKGGLDAAGEAVIDDTEKLVIDGDAARFAKKQQLWQDYEQRCKLDGKDPFAALRDVPYGTPDGKPRWTPDLGKTIKSDARKLPDALMTEFRKMQLAVDQDEIGTLFAHHQPIVFSGSSKDSWDKISPEEQANIRREMKSFLQSLDPKKAVAVTGGTHFGFEACIHELAQEINAARAPADRLKVVGAFVTGTRVDEVKADTLSHAFLIKAEGRYAESWRNQAPGLLELVEKYNGIAVMGGGGQAVRDIIVEAESMGLIASKQIMLFDGPTGASTEKAKFHPEVAFKTYDDLRQILDGRGPAAIMDSPVLREKPVPKTAPVNGKGL